MNRLLSGEMCPENFHEIGRFLTIVFQRNLSRKFPRISPEISRFSANLSLRIPRNVTFFPRPTTRPDIVRAKTNKVYKVRQMASIVLMRWMFLVSLVLWNSPLLTLSSTYTYITLPMLAPFASYLWLSSSITVNVTVPIFFCCGCCFPVSILYCRNM